MIGAQQHHRAPLSVSHGHWSSYAGHCRVDAPHCITHHIPHLGKTNCLQKMQHALENDNCPAFSVPNSRRDGTDAKRSASSVTSPGGLSTYGAFLR